MKQTALVSCIILLATASVVSADTGSREQVTLDNDVWVLFYDLPSRRFRNIRDAFVRRNWVLARRDLEASAGFLRTELGRADAALTNPMKEIIVRLEWIAENIESAEVSGSDLDAAFARAHWALAQHYLVMSESARSSGTWRAD